MIKTKTIKEEQAYCDICEEECYRNNEGEKYDFCSNHKELYGFVQKIVGDKKESALKLFENLLDEIADKKYLEIMDLAVEKTKKFFENKK